MEKIKKKISPYPYRRPVHPGEILKETVLPALNLPIYAFAQKLKISRSQLRKILNRKLSVDQNLAERLEKSIGRSAQSWMQLQRAFDDWMAKKKTMPDI